MNGLTVIGIIFALAIGGWFMWGVTRPRSECGKAYLKVILQRAGWDTGILPDEFFEDCVSHAEDCIAHFARAGKSRVYQNAELTRFLDNIPQYLSVWMDRSRKNLSTPPEGVPSAYNDIFQHYEKPLRSIRGLISLKGMGSEDKVIAEQISTSINVILQDSLCFNGLYGFPPPVTIWDDDYIVGFLFTLLQITLASEYGGTTMPAERKANIILMICVMVFGKDSHIIINRAFKMFFNEDAASPDFIRGDKAAEVLLSLGTSPIPEEIASIPLVKQAIDANAASRSFRKADSSESSTIATTYLRLVLNEAVFLNQKATETK